MQIFCVSMNLMVKKLFFLNRGLINSIISLFLLYSFFNILEYINEFYSPRFFFFYNIFLSVIQMETKIRMEELVRIEIVNRINF